MNRAKKQAPVYSTISLFDYKWPELQAHSLKVTVLHTSPRVQQWTEVFRLRLRYWEAKRKQRGNTNEDRRSREEDEKEGEITELD